MLTQWSRRIVVELDQLEAVPPGGVIHGQAEVGNVLLRDEKLVLIDFERVTIGPRAREVEVRLQTWRDEDLDTRWTAVLDQGRLRHR